MTAINIRDYVGLSRSLFSHNFIQSDCGKMLENGFTRVSGPCVDDGTLLLSCDVAQPNEGDGSFAKFIAGSLTTFDG